MTYRQLIESINDTILTLQEEGYSNKQISSFLFRGKQSLIKSVQKTHDLEGKTELSSLQIFAGSINCSLYLVLIDRDEAEDLKLQSRIKKHNARVIREVNTGDIEEGEIIRSFDSLEDSKKLKSEIFEHNSKKIDEIPTLCADEVRINGSKTLKDKSVIAPRKYETLDEEVIDGDDDDDEYFENLTI